MHYKTVLGCVNNYTASTFYATCMYNVLYMGFACNQTRPILLRDVCIVHLMVASVFVQQRNNGLDVSLFDEIEGLGTFHQYTV